MGRGNWARLALPDSAKCAILGCVQCPLGRVTVHVASLIPINLLLKLTEAFAYTTIDLFLFYSCGNIIIGLDEMCRNWLWELFVRELRP